MQAANTHCPSFIPKQGGGAGCGLQGSVAPLGLTGQGLNTATQAAQRRTPRCAPAPAAGSAAARGRSV